MNQLAASLQAAVDVTTAGATSLPTSCMPSELETTECCLHLLGHIVHKQTGVGQTILPYPGPAGAHHKPAEAPAGQPDAVPGIGAHDGRQACPVTPGHLQLRPQRLHIHFEGHHACRDQASYMN